MNYTNITVSFDEESDAAFKEFSNDFDKENNVFITPFEIEKEAFDVFADFKPDRTIGMYQQTPYDCDNDEDIADFTTFKDVIF